MTINDKFLTYLMQVENRPLYDTKNIDEYGFHVSPEGGTKTFGYGHKLDQIEQLTQQLENGTQFDEAEYGDAVELLKMDLQDANRRMSALIGPKYESLSRRQREMILDFAYNLGDPLQKFPKFTAAVLRDDLETMRKEYKRYYRNPRTRRMEPLVDRNEQFYNRYLSELALLGWSRGKM